MPSLRPHYSNSVKVINVQFEKAAKCDANLNRYNQTLVESNVLLSLQAYFHFSTKMTFDKVHFRIVTQNPSEILAAAVFLPLKAYIAKQANAWSIVNRIISKFYPLVVCNWPRSLPPFSAYASVLCILFYCGLICGTVRLLSKLCLIQRFTTMFLINI